MAATMTSPAGQAAAPSPDPVVRLAHTWWIDWPRRMLRRFPGSRGLAGDGHYLVTVPPLAVLAPVATIAVGFVVGATRTGYDVVWTESLVLMVALIALGTMSGVLGLLGVTAFALGDLLVGQPWEVGAEGLGAHLLQVRVPMVITYLLLAVVVVVIPRLGRGLALATGRARRIPTALAWPLASLVVVVVAWIGTRTWAAAAPTLIRPRFTWTGGEPIVEAIAPLQEQATVLVVTAMVTAIARQVWIGATLVPGPLRRAMAAAETRPVPWADDGAGGVGGGRVARLPGPWRRGLSDVVGAGLATLVLAGILEHAWVAALSFGVFLAIRLLRSGVLAVPGVAAWQRLATRVPAVVRLVVLWVLARVGTNALAGGVVASYTGLALMVVAGSLLVWALFPGHAADDDGGDGSDDAAPQPPSQRPPDREAPPPTAAPGHDTSPAGSSARGDAASPAGASAHGKKGMAQPRKATVLARRVGTVLAATAAIMLTAVATARPAVADNCGTFTDCFGQSNAAAEAGFGLMLLTGLSLLVDFIPVVGDVRGLSEAWTGRDMMTGQALSGFDRLLGVLALIPAFDLVRAGRHLDDFARAGDDLVGIGRRGDDVGALGRHGDGVAGRASGSSVGTGPSSWSRMDLGEGDLIPPSPGWSRRLDRSAAYPYLDRSVFPRSRFPDVNTTQMRKDLSEELGVAGGMSYLEQSLGRRLDLVDGLDGASASELSRRFAAGEAWDSAVSFGGGSRVTNIVYFDGDTLHVIEAKGGAGRYIDRESVHPRIKLDRIGQDDWQYPRDVGWDMANNETIRDGRQAVGRLLEVAFEDEVVRYVGVRTGGYGALLRGDPTTVLEHVFTP